MASDWPKPLRGAPGPPQEGDRQIGARIRQRRNMLGIAQQKMAELVGVTSQQAQKYESGSDRISAGGCSNSLRPWASRSATSSRMSSPSGAPPNPPRSTVFCSSSPATSPRSRTASCRKPSASWPGRSRTWTGRPRTELDRPQHYDHGESQPPSQTEPDAQAKFLTIPAVILMVCRSPRQAGTSMAGVSRLRLARNTPLRPSFHRRSTFSKCPMLDRRIYRQPTPAPMPTSASTALPAPAASAGGPCRWCGRGR